MKFSTKALLILSLIPFLSCKKTDTSDTQLAYLSIVNASPTIGTYYVYVNGSLVTAAALPFGGTTAYAEYLAGDYPIKLTPESSIENLMSKTLSLSGNTIYSYFIIDQQENLDGLLVTDNLSVTSTEKAYIRFINLSADAPSLDLAAAEAENLISGKAYKTASDFIAVDPKAYIFQIRDSSNATIKTTMESNTLVAGKYYTILARGLLNPGETDRAFSGQLITNL
ncbi:DUF4397 domain-containing protein [Pedobacter sp. GR22-6]|uniref:DUF4397 domain-containing protein n=1 Tax=Pedobacter sp. GR22-6 TaxID=3127957 RepID=UPI00307E24AD